MAELGRRGLIAAPFAGNVPLFDLLVADKSGHSIPVQVKAINRGAWQFNIQQFLRVEVHNGRQKVLGNVSLTMPDLVCILVLLRETGKDEFYILQMRDLQKQFAEHYPKMLAKHGGIRPRNDQSMHCAVLPKDLQQYKDKWQVVSEAIDVLCRGKRKNA